MAFTLENVVPWGRSYDEYSAMFDLSEIELELRILGCGDGPAAFNAVMAAKGHCVISADPLYRFSAVDVRQRIDDTYAAVMAETRKNIHEFVWRHIPSIDDLGKVRMAAMNAFLDDYESGLKAGRYIDASLPSLPFRDREFDLALCSHFLFLYSEHHAADFHVASIKELCRVASETRIFPLLELGAVKSRHLDAVVKALEGDGFAVAIRKVPYEFQKDGDEMMVVNRDEKI